MELTNATLTVPLGEYMGLREQIQKRDEEIAKLQAALQAERLRDPEDKAKKLFEAIKLALPIVGFAVSSLPPEAIRGWPYQALAAFGKLVQEIPGLEPHMIEQGKDFAIFSSEVKPFEEARARGEVIQARSGGPG